MRPPILTALLILVLAISCVSNKEAAPAQHDLGDTVVSVSLHETGDVKLAETITFTVAIENVGNEPVMFEPGEHDFWLLDQNDGIVWTSAGFRGGGSRPETTLRPGESAEYSRTWEPVTGSLRTTGGLTIPVSDYRLVGQLIVLLRQAGHSRDGEPSFLVSNRMAVSIVR